jgi:hypothetical protein
LLRAAADNFCRDNLKFQAINSFKININWIISNLLTNTILNLRFIHIYMQQYEECGVGT